MVRTQRAGERKKICSLCCTSRQSWEINSTFLRDDLFKPCLREYDCMKRGKYILLPWPPEPAATDRHAISWHHRHGREGGGKQGPGWRTSGIGEIIYYSPNNIAELAENCSNNPVSPPVICPIPLPLLFCKGCCSFCWRSPSEIAMLLPAFWSSFLQVKQARPTLFRVCLRGILKRTPHPVLTHCLRLQWGCWQPGNKGLPCRPPSTSSHAPGHPGLLIQKMPLGHQNPSPFLAVTRSDSGWRRGQPLGKCAETRQGILWAASLTCSVLFECLAILVPNKESIGAGQEVELVEVED